MADQIKEKKEIRNPKEDTLPKDEKYQKRSKGRKGKGNPKKDYDRKFKDNDASWYTKYKELSDIAARIAMHHRNGSDFTLEINNSITRFNLDPIITMGVLFCPGTAGNRQDGINIASDAMHKMLNRRYRGVYTKYQSADLGIAQLGILDFFASLSECYRAYGLALTYKLNQRQLPYNVLIALHIDPNDIVTRLSEFRYKLNQVALRARNLCLVRGYSVMDHWMFLMNNVFKDKDTERANLFGYYKPGYWKWNPTDVNTGSALQYVRYETHSVIVAGAPNISGLRTVDDLLKGLNDQLDALLTDDDIDQICSDILAFFGNKDDSADLVKVGFLPEDYTVDPIFSIMECKQFHNTSTFGAGLNTRLNEPNWGFNGKLPGYYTPIPTSYLVNTPAQDIWIYQDANGVIQFKLNCMDPSGTQAQDSGSTDEVYGSSVSAGASQGMIVIDDDILDPSPDEIMEITRQRFPIGTSNFTKTGTTYYYKTLGHCGSAVVLGFEIYALYESMSKASNSYGGTTYTKGSNNYVGTVYSNFLYNQNAMAAMSKFDWHPLLFVAYNPSPSAPQNIIGDTDNYVSFSPDILSDIHDVALLSEFKNPISEFIIKE